MDALHPDVFVACPHCGKPCRRRCGGLQRHIAVCRRNPERDAPPRLIPGRVCCLRCRLEVSGAKRLEVHAAFAHPLDAAPPAVSAPPPPPPAVPLVEQPIAAPPTCACGGPFARDLSDPAGRCLKCSGAYARTVGRRPTSYQAVAAAD